MKLTNLDRVVFPADGITKGDLVAYHRDVADRMVPHLRGRPLSLERFRGTIDDGGFFQQSVGKHFPEDLIGRVAIDRSVGFDPDVEPVMPHARGRPAPAPRSTVTVHPVADSADALVYLSNQGALTFHAWPARLPDLERPDALVLDLDPEDDDFAAVRRAAGLLRDVLDGVGLVSVPMLTGSRGLHVVVPLDGTLGWAPVWTMAKAIGAAHVERAPKELTRAFYKSQRRGRLYVDTARARRLLAEAGYPNGIDVALWSANVATIARIAQSIQGYLNAVGIRTKLEQRDAPSAREAARNGQVDLFVKTWYADYPDADAFLYPLLHSESKGVGGNYSFYANPTVDSLVALARRTQDDAQRAALSRQADSLSFACGCFGTSIRNGLVTSRASGICDLAELARNRWTTLSVSFSISFIRVTCFCPSTRKVLISSAVATSAALAACGPPRRYMK